MAISPGNLAALIVAASFAAGLNVYATVLTLGLLGREHWVTLPGNLGVLTETWVLVASALLFAAEFFADKLPGFDLVWNALHTVVRAPIAALLAWQATTHLSPQLQLAATVGGGLIALVTHTSKTAVRAVVTPSPEPVSNIALSTTEDVTAIGLTWLATHHPWLAGSLAVIGLLAAFATFRALLRALRSMGDRLRNWAAGFSTPQP